MRINYVLRRTKSFAYGKTWELTALEGGELTFITDWMWDVNSCKD